MSEYATMDDVIEAFRSSTTRNPKLAFGDVLEILVEEYGFAQDDASLALAPMMDGSELLEIWNNPSEEE